MNYSIFNTKLVLYLYLYVCYGFVKINTIKQTIYSEQKLFPYKHHDDVNSQNMLALFNTVLLKQSKSKGCCFVMAAVRMELNK